MFTVPLDECFAFCKSISYKGTAKQMENMDMYMVEIPQQ